MRLVICDDDKSLIAALKPFFYQYANIHKFDLVVEERHSGEELLSDSTVYDMIFLDFQMGKMDGMATARELRRRNIHSTIVFMTNYPDFVYESFEVNTFRFYKKPIGKPQVDAAMDAFFSMYGNDYPIRLRYEGETILVNTKNIVFIVAMGKFCIINLPVNKEHKVITSTMSSIVKMLPRRHFFKIHRCYYVNFNYIEKYNNKHVILRTESTIPISKRCLAPFKKTYKEYIDICNPRRSEDAK
jgi:DNA-binding LytR/AlgR family response regulator